MPERLNIKDCEASCAREIEFQRPAALEKAEKRGRAAAGKLNNQFQSLFDSLKEEKNGFHGFGILGESAKTKKNRRPSWPPGGRWSPGDDSHPQPAQPRRREEGGEGWGRALGALIAYEPALRGLRPKRLPGLLRSAPWTRLDQESPDGLS